MSYYIKPTYGPITSFMGRGRVHPIAGVIRAHQGIDIGSAADNRVWAAAAGYVSGVGYTDIAGNYVWVKHPNGQTTNYSHLRRVDVSRGDTVKQGQRLGMKGETGGAQGVHLHFEISKGDWTNNFSDKLNPLLYFVDPDTKEMQGWLKELGYDVEPDGYYGEKMISAVALYQKRKGMHVDGYAGRGTYATLKAETAQQVASDAPIKKEEDDEMKFSSPAARSLWETMIASKAQREIVIQMAVDAGYSKEWIKDLEEGKVEDGDLAGLMSGTMIKWHKQNK